MRLRNTLMTLYYDAEKNLELNHNVDNCDGEEN